MSGDRRMPQHITVEWLQWVRESGVQPRPADPSLIRLQPVTYGGADDGAERMVVVARDDYRHARNLDTEFTDSLGPPRAWVATFDHIAREPLEIAVASCGLPACRCGLAWRPVDCDGAPADPAAAGEVGA